MQAYVSCPLDIPMDKIREVGAKLNTLGYKPWWYERGTTYEDNKLKLSQVFVLMSENNEFDYCFDDMTAGCKKELELAISSGKKLYMAYWKKEKELNIYPIHPDKLKDDRVLGMSKNYMPPASGSVINNYSIY